MTGGVSDPAVHLVETPAMNAMVVADAERADLVLTTGLVDGLGRLELEGVVANLLGRVRDGSARYGTTVVGLLGSSGAASRRLAAGLGEQRSVHSDLAAVDMTRYPPGLISALARMSDAGTVVAGASPSTAHLWIAPVVDGAGLVAPEVAETAVQPLALRIAVLEEL
jgi:heat shock protein HtpX